MKGAMYAIAAAALLAACAPASNTLGWERSDGSAIIAKAMDAHGGLDRWRSFETAEFRYRERWSWPFSVMGVNPWPSNPVSGKLKLWLHKDWTTASLDDYPGASFHYRDGLLATADNPIDKPLPKWNGKFALPRTHFLTLLPWKFADGGARVEYLGRDGPFEKVMVTYAPGAGVTPEDRYWAWFDSSSGRLERVVLTVTAYGPLAVGDLRYEDWQAVSGLLAPGRIRATLHGAGLPLHEAEYEGWEFTGKESSASSSH